MVVADSPRVRKNSYGDAVNDCNVLDQEGEDEEARRISTNLARDLEKITASMEPSTEEDKPRRRMSNREITERRRSRSRERIQKKRGENKENTNGNEEVAIKSTRVEDILKGPEPPVRSDSKVKLQRMKSPEMARKRLMSPDRESRRKTPNRTPLDVVTSPTASPPMSPEPMSPTDRPGQSLLDTLRKRKERIMNNKPAVEKETPLSPKVSRAVSPIARAVSPVVSRSAAPVTNHSPPALPKAADDLETQTLESLEGLTATESLEALTDTIIKERDLARKERNEAREKCEVILEEYGGRRQVWQNSLNVVKLRLDHYERRHDKLRNDIVKQRNTFDIERTRMKDRHADQIEGLFGELFNKIKSDHTGIGSPSEVAEVNYKLDAFMKLWKGLATDVDDIYDKEHYCLRLCETVKSLEEQLDKQNKIIAMLLNGKIPVVPDTVKAPRKDSLPSPNINIALDEQQWDVKLPEEPIPDIAPASEPSTYTLPKFEELKLLDSMLPKSATSSTDDLLAQFSEIESQFDTLSNSLSRNALPTASPLTTRKPYTPKLKVQVRESPRVSPVVTPRAVSPVEVPVEMDAPVAAPVVDVRAAIANYEQPAEKPNVPKTAFSYTPVPEKEPPSPGAALEDMLADLAVETAKATPPQLLHIEPSEPPTPVEDPAPWGIVAPLSKLETTFDEPAVAPMSPEPPVRSAVPRVKKKKKRARPAAVVIPTPEPEPVCIPEPVPEPVLETTFDEPAIPEPEPVKELETTFDEPAIEPRPSEIKTSSPSEVSEESSTHSVNSIPMLNCSPKSSRAPSHYRLDLNEEEPAVPVERPITPVLEAAPEPEPEVEPLKVEPKSRKWTPSFPIFGKKAKSEKGGIKAPERAPSTTPSVPKTNPTTPSTPSDPPEAAPLAHNPYTPHNVKPPARPLKRAKSMPKLRKEDLEAEEEAPRNPPMKRYLSNRSLRHKKGDDDQDLSESEDSELEGLIANVYTPLHLTPHSRSLSRRTLGDDDAKSTTSSFARRAPIPASMGWLANNNGDSTCQSSSESESESDEESSDYSSGSQSDSGSQSGSGSESEEDNEAPDEPPPVPNRDSIMSEISCLATPDPVPQDEVMGELISSLLEDDWSKAYEQPPQDNREIAF